MSVERTGVDNDSHFWTIHLPWGICRNDLPRQVAPDDYVFFVLPKGALLHQCLFAYLHVREKISQSEAFSPPELRSKRMQQNKNPNGNIIVDATGGHNRFDKNLHRHMFRRIKDEYVVAWPDSSGLLSASEIDCLASQFQDLLRGPFGPCGSRPIDFISHYGRNLSAAQVNTILEWVHGLNRSLESQPRARS